MHACKVLRRLMRTPLNRLVMQSQIKTNVTEHCIKVLQFSMLMYLLLYWANYWYGVRPILKCLHCKLARFKNTYVYPRYTNIKSGSYTMRHVQTKCMGTLPVFGWLRCRYTHNTFVMLLVCFLLVTRILFLMYALSCCVGLFAHTYNIWLFKYWQRQLTLMHGVKLLNFMCKFLTLRRLWWKTVRNR